MTELPELRAALVAAARRQHETIQTEAAHVSLGARRYLTGRGSAFTAILALGATVAVLSAVGAFQSKTASRSAFLPVPGIYRGPSGYSNASLLFSPLTGIQTLAPVLRSRATQPSIPLTHRTCSVIYGRCEVGCLMAVAGSSQAQPHPSSACHGSGSIHPCTLFVSSTPALPSCGSDFRSLDQKLARKHPNTFP